MVAGGRSGRRQNHRLEPSWGHKEGRGGHWLSVGWGLATHQKGQTQWDTTSPSPHSELAAQGGLLNKNSSAEKYS